MHQKHPAFAGWLSLFLLSAASLAFEVNLTRLFAVAQFYHFAFMIVSLALLGIGASGTWLALRPTADGQQASSGLGNLPLAASGSILGGYLVVNHLPFDSFSMAWDSRQAVILALHYLALAAPFFFTGLAVGRRLASAPQAAGQLYAANLLGSAAGCAAALAAPAVLGGEGVVVLSSGLAALAGLVGPQRRRQSQVWAALQVLLLVFAGVDAGLRVMGLPSLDILALRLSPYKSLSYALQAPAAQVLSSRWNAFSRVDVVRSPSIRSLPGLSYRYLELPPAQDGLLVDGDELSPLLRPGSSSDYAAYLPGAVAYTLRPAARALVLDPRGGLDANTALALGARQVTVVEANALIVTASPVYQDERLEVVVMSDRSYLRRSTEGYDLVVLSLANSYHPVRSGAYSLAEDYRFTQEAFADIFERLAPHGLLVITRWLQTPPSECLRTFALAVTALEQAGADPARGILAFRGYSTITLLVQKEGFTADEVEHVNTFADQRAFDMVFAPGLSLQESNIFNILPESSYYLAFQELLRASPRQAFYAAYPYDVSPPSDDRPFFGHFFKWTQAGQVLAELGRTWQPFGGAGYFMLLVVLLLAVTAASMLILLPAALTHQRGSHPPPLRPLVYFGLIGLAYLFVEIPLIQRFILYLDHPAFALAAVLFSLLFFSGLGSLSGEKFSSSERISPQQVLWALPLILSGMLLLLPAIFEASLGFSLTARLVLSALLLAPAGFLMGLPFPAGIRWLGKLPGHDRLIPWAWAVNGAASVIASVLAALLALTFGFRLVFMLGALAYLCAWVVIKGGLHDASGQ